MIELSLSLSLLTVYTCHLFAHAVQCVVSCKKKTLKIEITTVLHGTICLSLLYADYVVLLKDSVLHLQEEMNRLQENLEKLKVQGSEDDSEEKVT